jgi:hypothetical protein
MRHDFLRLLQPALTASANFLMFWASQAIASSEARPGGIASIPLVPAKQAV